MSLEHEADPRRHGAHPNEVLKRRTAEQALAAALAREQVLRQALQATLDDDCDDLVSAAALLVKVEAALAAPADDTTLREFGLRVAREVDSSNSLDLSPESIEAAVDTVLRGAR